MIRAVRLEFQKMRRMRAGVILMLLIVAVAALASLSLFTTGTRSTFEDPAAMPWEGLLLKYGFAAAMTSPVLTAVLASRQTDIEYSAAGWALASTGGLRPGVLCRAKIIALGAILLPALVVQSLLIIGIGTVAGIHVPLDPWPWAHYTAMLFLIDLAFIALHTWLAVAADNQLVSVGVGMLGSLIAVFTMLMPGEFVRFIPWGYYAMVLQHAFSYPENVIVRITPPYAWIAGFLILTSFGFAMATRRLDRIER